MIGALAVSSDVEPLLFLHVAHPQAHREPGYEEGHISDVVFRLEDQPLDLIDHDLDVAFRITDEPPPGLVGRRLMRIEHIICASPAYLELHGMPAHPLELKQHSCITLSEEPADARWHFSKDGKHLHVDVQGRYAANHTALRLDAVLSNLDIGSLPLFIAEHALKSGQVVQVLPDWTFKTNYHGDVWMLYAPIRHLAPRIRVFVDFMVNRLIAQRPER